VLSLSLTTEILLVETNLTNGHPQDPPLKGGERVTELLPIQGFFAKINQEKFALVRVSLLQDGLSYLQQHQPDVILLDLNLPDRSGLEAIEAIQKITTEVPIVALVEAEQEIIALDAIGEGVQDYLLKSEISPKSLTKAIACAIKRQQIINNLRQSQLKEHKLARQAKFNQILAQITQNIHSSLDLDIILQTAVESVHQFLQAEIIFIAKIGECCQLTLLYESVLSELPLKCDLSVINEQILIENAENFEQLSIGKEVVQDQIEYFQHTPNSPSLSSVYSVLIVPIISSQKLWGVLCSKKYSFPRYWEVDEIKFLDRLTIQLGIAIQQSELYQQLERTNKELTKLAVIDGLTKIANRRKFDEYINSEWQRLAREKSSLSLILCDIDYFKLYNDTYGHQDGDRCLQQVAQAISKAIKRPADLVARYGGEEFAIILPNTSINGAIHLAQQIRLQIQALQLPHINSPVDIYITMSLGVASCIPSHDCDPNALIGMADTSLYQAKKLGRNRVVICQLENDGLR
jgi:diguanylate cyclase (GGDEF)-like protein